MQKFRKRPLEVKAVLYTGDNDDEILKFLLPNVDPDATSFDGTIKTLEGVMKVSKGDWIIKGIKGEFYLCKPDIFKELYEPLALRSS